MGWETELFRYSFAVLKTDGSVITWGSSSLGGDSSSVVSKVSYGVSELFATSGAYAALKTDGSIVTWGSILGGSDATAYRQQLSTDVVSVATSNNDFVASKEDGSLIFWGQNMHFSFQTVNNRKNKNSF